MANLQPVGRDYGNEGTYGPGSTFQGRQVLDSARYRSLAWKQAYYACTQHDHKKHDFDGRLVQKMGGGAFGAPLMTFEKSAYFVPLRERRPSFPARIGRVIVNAFTGLVFGEGRFPEIMCRGDVETQDFARTLSRVAHLPSRMILAATRAGATGTVCLSWCYRNGRPKVTVHNARNIYVHKWAHRDEHIVKHASEIWTFQQDDPDPKRPGQLVTNTYWRRRDWTMNADIMFKPVLHEEGKDPNESWEPDLGRSVIHNDGVCHLEWAQNLPTDQIDGEADYEGLYEQMDEYDTIWSVVTRSAKLNLDPTLKLKMDPAMLGKKAVAKGSDNSLIVGVDGDAEYLELEGQSVKAGIDLLGSMRREILEQAQCIVPDPDTVAAQGVSSVAIRAMYEPMLNKASIKREQLHQPIERILDGLITSARAKSGKKVFVFVDGVEVEDVFEVKLPKRAEEEDEVDEDGNPTGEKKVNMVERTPGEGEEIELEPRPYFTLTPADLGAIATYLSTSLGGTTAFMAVETAAGEMAKAIGKDGKEEWRKIQHAGAQAQQKQQDMFDDHDADAGGKVEHEMQLPGGAKVKTSKAPKPPPPKPPLPGMGGPPKPGAPPGMPGAKEMGGDESAGAKPPAGKPPK